MENSGISASWRTAISEFSGILIEIIGKNAS